MAANEIKVANGASTVIFDTAKNLSALMAGKKCVVVTDREIRRLHGSLFPDCPVITVPQGEAAKSLASLEALYDSFLERGLDRDSSVLAVGGGSVSDLAGFAASTWLRGIDFAFMPTSLLAMVDASVGGKNGIDFRNRKNLVGSFNQPRFVGIDPSFLRTLPYGEFNSGMGEIVKHAVLSGDGYMKLLERLAPAGRNMAEDDLALMIRLSVEYKAGVVTRDERESGERRLLNLGHTIGHGVEAVTGIPHGHAVAAGLSAACRLSVSMNRMSAPDADRIMDLIAAWNLPSSVAETLKRDIPDTRKAIAAAAFADKKRKGQDVLFALPVKPGQVEITPIPLRDLEAWIMEVE